MTGSNPSYAPVPARRALHDLVFTGARVIDPDRGVDAVLNVAVSEGSITAVGPDPLPASRTISADGMVLCPGFIDLHSHAQSKTGACLQAMDGVTTALDLELGAASVARALDVAQQEGRPINFGFSASWALTRMALFDNAAIDDPFTMFTRHQGSPLWKRRAGSHDVDRLLDALAREMDAGGIGIGALTGYAPDTARSEYFSLATLAARLGMPLFTHARYMSVKEPGTSLEGVLEVVSAAASTGAHIHLCHLNSTSNRMIDAVASTVDRARQAGVRVTTEVYPYGSSLTVIGADFLAPGRLDRLGLTPSRLFHIPTRRQVRDERHLALLRAEDPGSAVLMTWADEYDERDRAVLMRSLLMPDSAIASDATPAVLPGGSLVRNAWPLPVGALTHPRSAGCYARTFGWLVRDLEVLSLSEAVRRCSLLPAELLQDAVPEMARKGRIQEGADADIVIFDPDRFAERASYRTLRTSEGVRYLVVRGEIVVDDGVLDSASNAGRAVRGTACAQR